MDLTEIVQRHVGDDNVPGLAALVARGDDVRVEVAGSLTIGGSPVARDSLFRIASMTKPITGVLTEVLIAEGLLGLDESVERFLPELADLRVLRRIGGPLDDTVPAERSVTVRDLLTFTYGFGSAEEMFADTDELPIVAAERELGLHTLGPPQPALQPDPDTWVARLGELPLLAQPGERWLYNTGASVLGVLAARATGLPYDEVLRTRIFEPLGMSSTSMWTSQLDRLGASYAPTPRGLVAWDDPGGAWSRPPAFPDGAAGLVSTVDDLCAFAKMLLRGGDPILEPWAVAEMTRNHLSVRQREGTATILRGLGWGFCMAVVLEGPRTGSFGWNGGLGSSLLVDPERDLAIIVLTNRMFVSPELPAVHADVQAAVYDRIDP
jgi:CubicO group peptidase (beta-lactamase class C family)